MGLDELREDDIDFEGYHEEVLKKRNRLIERVKEILTFELGDLEGYVLEEYERDDVIGFGMVIGKGDTVRIKSVFEDNMASIVDGYTDVLLVEFSDHDLDSYEISFGVGEVHELEDSMLGIVRFIRDYLKEGIRWL